MSKSKASRRARDAKHVRLYLYVMKSEAWRSLSCPARCLLIELQALYNGTNNGELFLSVRSAAKALGGTLKAAAAAFRELEDRGFIRATRKGAMAQRGQARLATTWRLTEFNDDLTGRQPTKDFMTWRAPAETTVSARAERSRKANDARWGKFSSVSFKDTHRSPQGYARPARTPKNGPERSPKGYAQADFEAPSVSLKDTQLVNHHVLVENRAPNPETAHPSAAPYCDFEQRKAQVIRELEAMQREPPAPPRGPPSGRQFGPWLEDEAIARHVPLDFIAGALGVEVAHLIEMTSGRVQVLTSQRRRAEAALATYLASKPNGQGR